jgi:hypothetical protein
MTTLTTHENGSSLVLLSASELPKDLMDAVRLELESEDAWLHTKIMGLESIRGQVFFGEGVKYRFGGRTFTGRPFGEAISALKQHFEKETGHTYDIAVANRYTGQERKTNSRVASIPWHQDDEAIIDQETPIIGLQWGATMRFQIGVGGQSSATKPKKPLLTVETGDGDGLMMKGPKFQETFWHRVVPMAPTKNTNTLCVRHSLTFRGSK